MGGDRREEGRIGAKRGMGEGIGEGRGGKGRGGKGRGGKGEGEKEKGGEEKGRERRKREEGEAEHGRGRRIKTEEWSGRQSYVMM